MRKTKPLIAAILAIALTTPALALEQIRGSEFVLVSKVQLNSNGKRALAKFKRSNGAYGSFYTSRDGQEWAWNVGMFNQSDANKRAKAVCEVEAKAPCFPYARLHAKNSTGTYAIPSRARSGFNKALNGTKSGDFGAYAVTALGAWGTASNYPTAKAAREHALVECQAGAAKGRTDDRPAFRKVFDAKKYYSCRVIHTFQKQ